MKKIILIVAGVFTGLALFVVGGVGFALHKTKSAIAEPMDVAGESFEFVNDATAVAYGAHMFVTRGCGDCHGVNGGGKVFSEDPAFGILAASNLTSGKGGIGGSYSVQDWERAIRHGVGPNGRKLIFMISQDYNEMSNHELGSLIAYLQQLPPVDYTPFAAEIGPIGSILYVTGELPLLPAEIIDHSKSHADSPATTDTSAYGAYLLKMCSGCHGPTFSGGKIPGGAPDWPAAQNLTPHETGIKGWSEADFFKAMREGVRPDGSAINEAMPWKAMGQLYDWELHALWTAVSELPPKEFGGR